MIVNGIQVQNRQHLDELIVNMPENVKEFLINLFNSRQ